MLLADCALWASQDHRSGALVTSKRAAGLVIATAALADLIHAGALEVTTHQVRVLITAAAGPSRAGRGGAHAMPDSDDHRIEDEILWQISQEPQLSPAVVIDGLAHDIRGRVTRRLITTGAARARQRRFLWRTRQVAVAVDPVRGVTIPPLACLYSGSPLSDEDRFLTHLLAASTLGPIVFGHLPADTLTRALGPVDTLPTVYQPLLQVAVALLHTVALAR